jgi:hypothetical protein
MSILTETQVENWIGSDHTSKDELISLITDLLNNGVGLIHEEILDYAEESGVK